MVDVASAVGTRVDRIRGLGFDPYPRARQVAPSMRLGDAAVLADGDGGSVVGRILRATPVGDVFQVVLAGPSAGSTIGVEIARSPLVDELRPGDVIFCEVRRAGGVLLGGGVRPVVIAVRQLARPDAAQPISSGQREMEIFWDESVRAVVERSARVLGFIRSLLHRHEFVEVAMPSLVANPDVSPNVPFRTASTGGTQYVLRTTYPYSERLLFSMEKAYQLGPTFRDEPMGFERNPEFTMLSLGQTMADYDTMMDLGEQLLRETAQHVVGRTRLSFLGVDVDLAVPWRRLTVAEAVADITGVQIGDCFDLSRLEDIVCGLGLGLPQTPYARHRSQIYHSMVFDVLLKNLVYPRLLQPTFLTEFPFFFGGPGRPVDGDGLFKMRAEGFVSGVEVAETAGVLTDPAAIRAWHEMALAAKRGVGWQQALDEGYLDTMDHGILCPGIIAFGIERLLMLVLEKDSISDTMLYPNDI